MNEKENYAQCISNAKLGETRFSYTLSLIPILDMMCDRGAANRE